MKIHPKTVSCILTICFLMTLSVSHGQSKKKVVGSRPSTEVKANPLIIHPNPASDEISLHLQTKMQHVFDLEIHSKQGLRVLSKKWNGEKIDVSGFQTGVYILTLKRKKEVYSQKLVVHR